MRFSFNRFACECADCRARQDREWDRFVVGHFEEEMELDNIREQIASIANGGVAARINAYVGQAA